MARLMRCKYCGTLQDEPRGAKVCAQCGGELAFLAGDGWVSTSAAQSGGSFVRAQLELDQVAAPGGKVVERHLVITVQTPDEVPPVERASAVGGREAMHFVAVLDVSGSMRGRKIQAALDAVRQAVQRLQDGDVFSLVTFASDVWAPLQRKRVDGALRRVVRSSLQEIEAGGQTALCGGLELGIEQAASDPQRTNLVLVLSDGQANVGETDVEAVGRRAMDARAKGVTVSTLGVGADYNEALMAEIAIDGGGRFYHIANAAQIAAYLTGELGEMTSLAARGAAVTLELPPQATVQSLSAAYPVDTHTVMLGDISVGTTLEVIVRLLLPAPGGPRLPITGVLNYRSPADHALVTPLNTVTVRYDLGEQIALGEGVVKPVVRRVLDHMQAASVLAASKAAASSADEAERHRDGAVRALRQYAALLGEDPSIVDALDRNEQVLRAMATPSSATKAATYAAMRRHRGSKDFGQT